jgi:dolichol-phosphate mannosyltransferase
VTEAIDELSVQLHAESGQRPLIVGMSKWAAAAAVSFYTRNGSHDHITARNLVGLPASQWEFWFNPQGFADDRPVQTLYYRIGEGFRPEQVRRPGK